MSSLRGMELFVAAYEERSFTAAAERENATQSGVSQHVRLIEDRFQVRLFTRRSGGVVPTPAGDAYYRQCIDVLRSYDAANKGLKRFATGLDGEVVIGLMPTMTRSVLAPALARYAELHPNVSVSVSEGYSATLTDGVLAGDLAFAVVPAFPGAPGLRIRSFARTPEMVVAARSAAPPGGAAGILAREPLKIVLPRSQHTRRRTIDAYLASNHIRVDRLMELDSMFGTLDMIARTDWVSILPGLLMATGNAGEPFTVEPLTAPPLSLELMLIESARRVPSPAEEAFLAILEEETQRVNGLIIHQRT